MDSPLVEFTWTVSLGQVISTVIVVATVALGYVGAFGMYLKEHARIKTLEKEVAKLQSEIERFTEIIKRSGL